MTQQSNDYQAQVLDLAKAKGAINARDLRNAGIPRQYLHRLQTRGLLERVARGVYVLPEADITEHHTLVQANRLIPGGVVCLITALRVHGLTTQNPSEVWLAIDHKSWKPDPETLPVRFVYMSGAAFEEGIQEHEMEGVNVPVFSPPKTVADCFKYRNKIGIDVAIEALTDYRRSPEYDSEALWQYAKICRVSRVMRPYMEAVG